jgi:hypothetical protein
MAAQRSRERQERLAEAAKADTEEQALAVMGFPNPKRLELFPWGLAMLVPGLGQIVNGRHIPRQWIKGFLFSWFFWYFIFRNPLPAAAIVLFVASAVDFLYTRGRYNRRLAEAKEELAPRFASRRPRQNPTGPRFS